MDTAEHFTRLFAYDGWANQEVLAGLRGPTPPPRPFKVMAHILAAEKLWLERLEGQRQTLPVWPEFTTEKCARHAAELPMLWKKYLAASSEDDLAKPVS